MTVAVEPTPGTPPKKETHVLKAVEDLDVDELWAKGAHIEACDCLTERKELHKIRQLPLDRVDASRLVLYMTSVANLTPDLEERKVLLETSYDIATTHGDVVTALQISIMLKDDDRIFDLFRLCRSAEEDVAAERKTAVLESLDSWPESCRLTYGLTVAEEVEQETRLRSLMILQLCYVLSRHRLVDENRILPFVDDNIIGGIEGLKRILRREHLADLYPYLASELEVVDARHPDEIFKMDPEDQKRRSRSSAAALDSSKQALVSAYVSGFVHAGFGSDAILLQEGSTFINRARGSGLTAATAALGLICLWNVEEGLSQIDKFQYSADLNTRMGALMAFGINSCQVANECDPVLNLVSDAVSKAASPQERAAAAISLGYAYVGTARTEISELLVPLLLNMESGMETSASAALALGLVFVGSADEGVTEAIMQALIERSATDGIESVHAVNFSIALALVCLERRDAVEVVLAGLSAVSHPIGEFTRYLTEGMAHAGSGDVVKIQEMVQACLAKAEEASKDEPENKESTDIAEDAATKNAEIKRTKEEFVAATPGACVLAVALITLRDELGQEMVLRLIHHLLQFDGLFVRRSVPLALAMLHASNPSPQIVDLMSKLTHDTDADIALHAIVGLGVVAAGTNNARVAQVLRQLSVYYSAEPNAVFLVRLAQGLLYCGKGLVSLSPLDADRRLLNHGALAGIFSFITQALFTKDTLSSDQPHHLNFYHLVPAIHPRWLITVDEELTPVAVPVRIGQAIDVAGMAGQPKKITGFRTHSTPVLLAHDERVQMGGSEWHPLSPTLEGIVIVRKLQGKDQAIAAKALD